MPWFRHANDAERQALQDEQYGSASWDSPIDTADYFVVDIETSGFSPQRDIVLSISSACVSTSTVDEPLNLAYELVAHSDIALRVVPPKIWELTKLSPDCFVNRREWRDILFDSLQRSVDKVWVAHHARHELSFLQKYAREFWHLHLHPIVIDTSLVAQALLGRATAPTLDEVCAWLGVPVGGRHRADEDVRMTVDVWQREAKLCEAIGLSTVGQVVEWTLARAQG